jgi:YfiH family protein
VERRTSPDGVTLLVSTLLARRGVVAAFSERTGGASGPPFDSLNLGYRTGDRPDRVLENRRRMASLLEIPAFATAEQVHGRRLARVGPARAGAGFDSERAAIPGSDALVVSRPRIAVAVLVADCVPLVLASDDVLVAVHAGWRGLAAGIVDRALEALPSGRPSAAIGPAIGPCHYEVGADVAEAVRAGSRAGARVEHRDGRTWLDLPATVEGILRARGVPDIDLAEVCTACAPERFFSHRRDGVTGRQAAVAYRLGARGRHR